VADLLTALDVENKTFSKSMRGYAQSEVDDFLDKVADDIQRYVEMNAELKRRIERLEEQIGEYTNLKETLQGTLLMAQKTAEAKEETATRQAETIISDAKVRAERILVDAAGGRDAIVRDMVRIRQERQNFAAEFSGLLSRFRSILEAEEKTADPARANAADNPGGA
jgi:cell division initiation protein